MCVCVCVQWMSMWRRPLFQHVRVFDVVAVSAVVVVVVVTPETLLTFRFFILNLFNT